VGAQVNSDVVLSVLGVALVVLPYVRWHVRERRHVLDAATHALFMQWLEALERAGYEQARDINTVAVVARYRHGRRRSMEAALAHSRS
jgi:hypothetical protein